MYWSIQILVSRFSSFPIFLFSSPFYPQSTRLKFAVAGAGSGDQSFEFMFSRNLILKFCPRGPAAFILAACMLAEVAAADSGFAPTVAHATPAPAAGPDGMVWIPGGEFSMGANIEAEDMCSLPGATKDAQPIHRVRVDPFWMDATEVTNEQFAKFVAATGYITVAEQKPTEAEFPGAPPEVLVAGSILFTTMPGPVPLTQARWWSYVAGVSWQHPAGPGSDVKNAGKVPVVHIAYEDAAAYAQWAGKRLPTEA